MDPWVCAYGPLKWVCSYEHGNALVIRGGERKVNRFRLHFVAAILLAVGKDRSTGAVVLLCRADRSSLPGLPATYESGVAAGTPALPPKSRWVYPSTGKSKKSWGEEGGSTRDGPPGTSK